MKTNKSRANDTISLAAIAGNLLFILWILYNGINEGFQANLIEKISYIALMGLLAVNAFLLVKYRIK